MKEFRVENGGYKERMERRIEKGVMVVQKPKLPCKWFKF
jgi:hypothetical protein